MLTKVFPIAILSTYFSNNMGPAESSPSTIKRLTKWRKHALLVSDIPRERLKKQFKISFESVILEKVVIGIQAIQVRQ